MKRLFLLFAILLPLAACARHQILAPNVKSLQVQVNDDWLSPPVMTLGSEDVLRVSFDELSHNYHRFVVHLEHCTPNWQPTEGLFDSDWLEGFNDWPIDSYENSINTTVLFTHYQLQIPNEQCRLRLSGNYRLHVIDEDNDNQEVLTAEFRIVEPLMTVALSISANTDIDHNQSHQQVSMKVNYNALRVTNPEEQIQTYVMQNNREDNMKENVAPSYKNQKGMEWEHNRGMIFEAGNEYHKFEMLDPSHTTMGLEHIEWNETDRHYHAYPFDCEPQRNYTYDEDADGAFIIRNSENTETDLTCDYIYVHYKLKALREYPDTRVIVDGSWTTEPADTYQMTYDHSDRSYHATILQKQGYYNYQLLMLDADGLTHRMPEEGSFFQTGNRYQALIYYKGTGARAWRLVGYRQVIHKGA